MLYVLLLHTTFIFYAILGNHLVRRGNSPPVLRGENGAIVSFLTRFFLRTEIKNGMEQSSIRVFPQRALYYFAQALSTISNDGLLVSQCTFDSFLS